VITLTLLHPVQSTPVQIWTFEQESVIRIGRATDNQVVLYSAVVSRHHVELRYQSPDTWEMVSLGANGTYLNGQPISQVTVLNGAIIRLARSGPNLQIHFDGEKVPSPKQQNQRLLDSMHSRAQTQISADTDLLTVEEQHSEELGEVQPGTSVARLN
jgi:pSer/pThr/pTyr-binding forkhead associated (FHA) protein